MSATILSNLKELQKQSDKRLNMTTIHFIQNREKPRSLVAREFVANTKWIVKPRRGLASLSQAKNTQSLRKIRTLTPSQDGNIKHSLNSALLGGQNYPILTAVIGTAVGLANLGAGLLFTVGTTGLSLSQTSQRILARSGDEIWHVEEIGKVRNGSSYKAVYVSSFFIVDPFRKDAHRGQSDSKGWLIHEEREELSLNQ